MNSIKGPAIAIGLLLLLTAGKAHAQVPFFNGGASSFDPEISILNTGTVTDVSATVSADRKYVTLTNRFSQSDLLALRSFSFQTGSAGNGNGAENGFVGVGAPAPAAANGAAAPQKETILTRPGMTLLNARPPAKAVAAPASAAAAKTAP